MLLSGKNIDLNVAEEVDPDKSTTYLQLMQKIPHVTATAVVFELIGGNANSLYA